MENNFINVELYRHPAAYARDHGELKQYRASKRANIACRDGIDRAISEHYRNNCLDEAAVIQIAEEFGIERMFYVLANTLRCQEWDGRYSHDNREWANSMDIHADKDTMGWDRNKEFVLHSHPVKVDLFLTIAREKYGD